MAVEADPRRSLNATRQPVQAPTHPNAVAASRPSVPLPILESRVIAIGRGLEPDSVQAVAQALVAGGIRAFELTLNSQDALPAIEALRQRYSEPELLIGAGTVLDRQTAAKAVASGASFLVMPHVDDELIAWCADRGIPAFPGGCTPTEIIQAWRAGAAAVKLFPASTTGTDFVREMRGPLPEIPLIPTGGVTLETAGELIAAGAVAVAMGGWLTGARDPGVIRRRATELVASLQALPR
ncbi:MAG: 2-dehydro-3-deoxyphosphogluconate aldolase [Candidatus Dormiibacter spiritus]|uniref:bifunctional 4-hydroxy-2-oxoglutarate aldolase/2-dehydro-3-deoxy-phosphogluconate aldolase n=1 Tax=Candidatus Dormibacter sp. TaxID=2973982 RepID=UPI000DAF71C3|nr:MAG: 2-dehydro-3-deoxyphosphogluconate aldolase [Candidatus Dormibacteraeota bacterium]